MTEVACWAHVRHHFFNEWKSSGSPIAKEAMERIRVLFYIERLMAGAPPEQRRDLRQRAARQKPDELSDWLDAQLARVSGRSYLAGAIRCAGSRWAALTAYVNHGQLGISNTRPRTRSGR